MKGFPLQNNLIFFIEKCLKDNKTFPVILAFGTLQEWTVNPVYVDDFYRSVFQVYYVNYYIYYCNNNTMYSLFSQLHTSFPERVYLFTAGDKQLADGKIVGESAFITLQNFHDRYTSPNQPSIISDSDDEYVRLLYPMAIKAEGAFKIHFNVDGTNKLYEERYDAYSHR